MGLKTGRQLKCSLVGIFLGLLNLESKITIECPKFENLNNEHEINKPFLSCCKNSVMLNNHQEKEDEIIFTN